MRKSVGKPNRCITQCPVYTMLHPVWFPVDEVAVGTVEVDGIFFSVALFITYYR